MAQLSQADSSWLEKVLKAAHSRLKSASDGQVPERAKSLDIMESAMREFSTGSPSIVAIRDALTVAYADLVHVPDTSSLRQAIRAVVWHVFQVKLP